MARRSATDVEDSRAAVVEAAVDLASVIGLEGLTIGRLATGLQMSKSGLIGRFGDKEQLQRATLAAAIVRFTEAVWTPAATTPAGLPRLEAVIDAWITHLGDGTFPGGCFITTASVEYDARPGPLRDDIAAAANRWLAVLQADAAEALRAGDLPSDRTPADIALELYALASGGSVLARLTNATTGLDHVRAAMRRAIHLPA